jgi:chromate transport protein ChrA
MTRPNPPASSRVALAMVVTYAVTMGWTAAGAWLMSAFGNRSLDLTTTRLSVLGLAGVVLAWFIVQIAVRFPDRGGVDSVRSAFGIAAIVVVVDMIFGSTANSREGSLRVAALLVGIPTLELIAKRIVDGGRPAAGDR